MNNTLEHNQLMDDILFEVGSKSNIRLWPRVVGFDQARKIMYGIKGEADLQGIISPGGWMLAIECKTGTGRLSVHQKRYREMIDRFGGIYIEARSVKQVLAEIEEYIYRKGRQPSVATD